MFKQIKLLLAQRAAHKKKKVATVTYTLSHILLVLYNNLKAMKTISDKQRLDLFNLYSKVLYDTMTDTNKIIFARAVADTHATIDQIITRVPTNQIQIKRQLEELFRVEK